MLIHINRAISINNPQLFEFVEAKSIWYPLYYIIDRRVRESVHLQSWLAEQLTKPTEALELIAATFDKTQSTDYLMTDILCWVHNNISYVSDSKVYKTVEKWQTPSETLVLKTGDCEDGAILIYALAHMCGVNDNRLLLFAGDVKSAAGTEGHCWLGYRSDEYPLNWCFMDWCYWFDQTTPNTRTKYYIKDTKIYDDPLNHYLNIWFAFNATKSFKGIMNQ